MALIHWAAWSRSVGSWVPLFRYFPLFLSQLSKSITPKMARISSPKTISISPRDIVAHFLFRRHKAANSPTPRQSKPSIAGGKNQDSGSDRSAWKQIKCSDRDCQISRQDCWVIERSGLIWHNLQAQQGAPPSRLHAKRNPRYIYGRKSCDESRLFAPTRRQCLGRDRRAMA